MNDTISRIRLLNRLKHRRDAFCKNRTEFLGLSKNDKARVDEMDKCIAEVINAPTIEPEREKGEWIKLYRGTIAEGLHCSVCGKHGYRSDFCPNCGADMRGERDGEN